jgi:malonyl-CoA O-methyltransferase
LEPLKLAGERHHRKDYMDAVKLSLNYYLSRNDLTEFNCLTHFHAYIVEALIDLGRRKEALDALMMIQTYQRRDGAIPAFPNVKWVCLVGMLQYSVCFYKLGYLSEGNVLLDYVIKRQRKSGGFYGGDGFFVKYFKKVEISWACKYLLDAISARLKLEIEEKPAASEIG